MFATLMIGCSSISAEVLRLLFRFLEWADSFAVLSACLLFSDLQFSNQKTVGAEIYLDNLTPGEGMLPRIQRRYYPSKHTSMVITSSDHVDKTSATTKLTFVSRL
jgi:hypothetical protein